MPRTIDGKGVVHSKTKNAREYLSSRVDSDSCEWQLNLRIGLDEKGVHRLVVCLEGWSCGGVVGFEIEYRTDWPQSLQLQLEDGKVDGWDRSKRRQTGHREGEKAGCWTRAARVRVRG